MCIYLHTYMQQLAYTRSNYEVEWREKGNSWTSSMQIKCLTDGINHVRATILGQNSQQDWPSASGVIGLVYLGMNREEEQATAGINMRLRGQWFLLSEHVCAQSRLGFITRIPTLCGCDCVSTPNIHDVQTFSVWINMTSRRSLSPWTWLNVAKSIDK